MADFDMSEPFFLDEVWARQVKSLNCAPWAEADRIERVKSRILDAAKLKEWKVASANPAVGFYYVNQYSDGSFTCNCPQFGGADKTCKHVKAILEQLARDEEVDKFLNQSREVMDRAWKRIANLPQRPYMHLIVNTSATAGFADNDYLCGYLKPKLERLAHSRIINISASEFEPFAHRPTEVTCPSCWERIRLIKSSMGQFANAMNAIQIWGDLGQRQ